MKSIICDICGKVMPYDSTYYGFVRIRTGMISDPDDDIEACITLKALLQ